MIKVIEKLSNISIKLFLGPGMAAFHGKSGLTIMGHPQLWNNLNRSGISA